MGLSGGQDRAGCSRRFQWPIRRNYAVRDLARACGSSLGPEPDYRTAIASDAALRWPYCPPSTGCWTTKMPSASPPVAHWATSRISRSLIWEQNECPRLKRSHGGITWCVGVRPTLLVSVVNPLAPGAVFTIATSRVRRRVVGRGVTTRCGASGNLGLAGFAGGDETRHEDGDVIDVDSRRQQRSIEMVCEISIWRNGASCRYESGEAFL